MHLPVENPFGKRLADGHSLDWLEGNRAGPKERIPCRRVRLPETRTRKRETCGRASEYQSDARHVFMTGTTNIETVYLAVEAGPIAYWANRLSAADSFMYSQNN